jgi:hypothetical protein
MNEFSRLGFEARSEATMKNVVKNRDAIKEEKDYHATVKAAADAKMAAVVDYKYVLRGTLLNE